MGTCSFYGRDGMLYLLVMGGNNDSGSSELCINDRITDFLLIPQYPFLTGKISHKLSLAVAFFLGLKKVLCGKPSGGKII